MTTTHPCDSTRPLAALQRLAWQRGHAATWKTIQVFSTKRAAVQALCGLPAHLNARARVLTDVSEAMHIGALTRDSI